MKIIVQQRVGRTKALSRKQRMEVWKLVEKYIELKQERKVVAAPSMGLMKDLQSYLHTNGIAYKVLKGTSKQGASNGISLCTLHSLKGLEFKVVVLIGINERNIPSKVTERYPFIGMDALDKKEFLSSKRSLLYGAITRARQLVYMIGYN